MGKLSPGLITFFRIILMLTVFLIFVPETLVPIFQIIPHYFVPILLTYHLLLLLFHPLPLPPLDLVSPGTKLHLKTSPLTVRLSLITCLELSDSVVGCCDPSCTTHHPCMDKFCDDLASCLDDAACKTLPLTHPASTVAGWNSSARWFKKKANCWHRVWKQAGSPSAGIPHQLKSYQDLGTNMKCSISKVASFTFRERRWQRLWPPLTLKASGSKARD